MDDIRAIVQEEGPVIKFTLEDVSSRYLQEEGDMANLMARGGPCTVRIVGRRLINTMIH